VLFQTELSRTMHHTPLHVPRFERGRRTMPRATKGEGFDRPVDHAIMQACNHAIVQSCNHAIMQSCRHAVMRSCDHAIMRSCDRAIMQACGRAVVQSCGRTVVACGRTVVRSCDHATAQPRGEAQKMRWNEKNSDATDLQLLILMALVIERNACVNVGAQAVRTAVVHATRVAVVASAVS
jgi:hypothetical protein